MPDLDLTEITAVRGTAADVASELRTVDLDLARVRRRAERAAAHGNRTEAETARTESLRLERERGVLRDRLDAAADRMRELSEAIAIATSPEDAIATLTGEVPVLMLPARLETRYFDGGDTLKIRVFPDQAHVTAHDPAATEDEVAGLTWYWQQRWADLSSTDLADKVWQGLTSRLRPGRAAFLVRTYPPPDRSTRVPQLPEIPRRSGDELIPGIASLLPDRWCAIGFRRLREGSHSRMFQVWGSAVPDTLSAGPGFGRDAGAETDRDLAWIDDPAAAEKVGMLLTVRQRDCEQGRLRDGVDRLVVLGVDWTRGPDAAAEAVHEHLAAHAGQGRMAFVPQGSPTNSTGTVRSGFSTDPTLLRDVLAPHQTSRQGNDSAGAVLAAALGLSPASLGHLPGADLREQAWQGALLESLWSATGGYYLTEMLDPLADEPALEKALRRHVAAHLRPGGPLPTVRIAAQPYGVLPVVPRDGYRPGRRSRAEREVHRVATAFRRMAEPLVDKVPRLEQVTRRKDVDDTVLALLQRTPVMWSLTFRSLVGGERQALDSYWTQLGSYQRYLTAILLAQLGATQLPFLANLTHDPQDHPLRVPLVLRTEPDGTRGTGYLAEIVQLLTRSDGRLILDGRQDASALLEALLACAAVREVDRAAKAAVAQKMDTVALAEPLREYVGRAADRLPATLRVEEATAAAGMVQPAIEAPRTPEEFARMVIPGVTGSATVAQTVATDLRAKLRDVTRLRSTPQDPVYYLAELRQALVTLQDAPADQLEWAFRSVLDVYSTRLDAWVTSLATARLHDQREARPTGVHVGGWGLVEGLRPDKGPAAESLGYVHTPSLGQAASAAVLRSARAAHRDDQGRVFDLDLSSQRVRQALTILEGVSQGQRLAALLGYRFERSLHEAGDGSAAQWIPQLRGRFPLRSDRPDDPTKPPMTPAWESGQADQPVESVAARDVVDGVALLERYEDDGADMWTTVGIDMEDRATVDSVARSLADMADAVSDVLVAEAVHQATVGNLERSGAALAAHDQQGPPPDPEFVRTPRAGHAVAHRVGVWLPADDPGPAPSWPADLCTAAEPRLDHWVGTLLGSPNRWQVRGRLHRAPVPAGTGQAPGGTAPAPSGVGPTPVDLGTVRPSELGVGALHLALASRRPGPGQPSALEFLLQQQLLTTARAAAFAAGGDLVVGAADQVVLEGDDLPRLLDVAGWTADIAGARELTPSDLASSADVVAQPDTLAGSVDVAEAAARADGLITKVRHTVADLRQKRDDWVAGPSTSTETALLAAIQPLLAMPAVDVAPVPAEAGGAGAASSTDGDLAVRADAVIAAAEAVLATLPSAVPSATQPSGTSPADQAEDPHLVRARAVVRTLLGPDQPFLPVVVPADPQELTASLADRNALLCNEDTAVVTWLHRMALVRPGLDALSAVLTEAEAQSGAAADAVSASLRLVQSPHRPGRPWVALPFGAAGPPEHGTVAVVLHALQAVDAVSAGGAGVIVDDWTETIPASHEMTAVTFHYDSPGARAPQSMLLCVHPEPGRSWSLGDLVGCVNEATDLARLRTLSSKELTPFATFLPTLFLPDSYTRDTPGLRIMELVAHLEHLGTGGLLADFVVGKAGTGDA